MMKRSTQIDTINFVFNEMPAAKAQQYLTALDNNDELFTYFSEVIALMSDLDEAPISPSKSAVDAIVAYASKARKVIS